MKRFISPVKKVKFPWSSAKRAMPMCQITINNLPSYNLNALPYDVLAEIFIHCLPLFDDCLPTSNDSDFPTRYPVIEPLLPHPRSILSILEKVSCRWRKVVMDTPLLWTVIILDTKRDNARYVQQCLQRSKDKRLDIFIRPWSQMSSYWTFHRVLPLLSAHLDRVRILKAYTNPRELSALFTRDRVINMPQIRFLYIYFDANSLTRLVRGDLEHVPSLRVYAPNVIYLQAFHPRLLRDLSLPRGHVFPIRYIFLDTTFGRPSELLDLLGCCPHLEQLSMFEYDGYGLWVPRGPRFPTLRYTFPKLTELCLLGAHSEDRVFSVRSLHMPLLRQVYIGNFDTPDPPNVEYKTELCYYILREYSRTITHFRVDNMSPSGMDVIRRHLSCFRDIRELDFSYILIPQAFFVSLIPDPGSKAESWPCPHLDTLRFKYTDIEDDTLLQLVIARCMTDKELTESFGDDRTDVLKASALMANPRWKLSNITFTRCVFFEDTLLEGLLELSREYSKIIEIKSSSGDE